MTEQIEPWVKDSDGEWLCPDCMNYLGMGIDPIENEWSYCPYCGKPKEDWDYDEG